MLFIPQVVINHKTTSGLNTNFSLSSCYSFHKSLYHKSFFLSNHSSNFPLFRNKNKNKTKNNNTHFGAYLYSMSTKRGNLHPAGRPSLLCRPTQEPVLATANRGKTWERFWKNAGEISTKEIPGSKRSMHGYILTYSRFQRENV